MLKSKGRFATGHAANSVKAICGSPAWFIKDLEESKCCEGKGSVPLRESGPEPAHGSGGRRPDTRPPRCARQVPAARPRLTDGDGRHDERVPEEQRRRFGRQVAAEVLKEQVFLGLLLGAAFGSHG